MPGLDFLFRMILFCIFTFKTSSHGKVLVKWMIPKAFLKNPLFMSLPLDSHCTKCGLWTRTSHFLEIYLNQRILALSHVSWVIIHILTRFPGHVWAQKNLRSIFLDHATIISGLESLWAALPISQCLLSTCYLIPTQQPELSFLSFFFKNIIYLFGCIGS